MAISRVLQSIDPNVTMFDVWRDIRSERALRSFRGLPPRRLTNIPGPDFNQPYGGVHAAEGFRVLMKRGFTLVEAWPGRSGRRSWEDFATTLGREGVWLLMMPAHLDLHIAGKTVPWKGWTIHKAWRVFPPTVTITTDKEVQLPLWDDIAETGGRLRHPSLSTSD
jgi:hypothetical protein